MLKENAGFCGARSERGLELGLPSAPASVPFSEVPADGAVLASLAPESKGKWEDTVVCLPPPAETGEVADLALSWVGELSCPWAACTGVRPSTLPLALAGIVPETLEFWSSNSPKAFTGLTAAGALDSEADEANFSRERSSSFELAGTL